MYFSPYWEKRWLTNKIYYFGHMPMSAAVSVESCIRLSCI